MLNQPCCLAQAWKKTSITAKIFQDICVKMAQMLGSAVPRTVRLKETSDFLEEKMRLKDRWSCATMVFGVECVIQVGVPAQHQLCAVHWDIPHYVRML